MNNISNNKRKENDDSSNYCSKDVILRLITKTGLIDFAKLYKSVLEKYVYIQNISTQSK